MSKQSRARAKRHHHKKKVGTGAMAPVMVRRFSESTRYELLNDMLDTLHQELYKKRMTWGTDVLGLFYCELWSELMAIVKKQRKSPSKERTLKLIVDIKVYQTREEQ